MIPKVNRSDIQRFLTSIKSSLSDENFDVDDDFILIKSNKDDIEYSTLYTLLDLEFDVYDVVNVLKSLEVEDFSEIKIDEDDPDPPLLYVFGKFINKREIYIKIKYRNSADLNQVICVSFHYAKWKMSYMFGK